MITNTIETEIYKDVPGKKGYVKHVGMKTIGEVYKQIVNKLDDEVFSKFDYFLCSNGQNDMPFPYGRWVAVYPVIGDNEGHYIHVDVIGVVDFKTNDYIKDRKNVYIGKTFHGFEVAAEIANSISRLFNK